MCCLVDFFLVILNITCSLIPTHDLIAYYADNAWFSLILLIVFLFSHTVMIIIIFTSFPVVRHFVKLSSSHQFPQTGFFCRVFMSPSLMRDSSPGNNNLDWEIFFRTSTISFCFLLYYRVSADNSVISLMCLPLKVSFKGIVWYFSLSNLKMICLALWRVWLQ